MIQRKNPPIVEVYAARLAGLLICNRLIPTACAVG
jgi:hypothetical protein